jgi:hypothetical protein
MSLLTQLNGLNLNGTEGDIVLFNNNKWINYSVNNLHSVMYVHPPTIGAPDINGYTINDIAQTETYFFNLIASPTGQYIPYIIRLPIAPSKLKILNLKISCSISMVIIITQSNTVFTYTNAGIIDYSVPSNPISIINMYANNTQTPLSTIISSFTTAITPIDITLYYNTTDSTYNFTNSLSNISQFAPNTSLSLVIPIPSPGT